MSTKSPQMHTREQNESATSTQVWFLCGVVQGLKTSTGIGYDMNRCRLYVQVNTSAYFVCKTVGVK